MPASLPSKAQLMDASLPYPSQRSPVFGRSAIATSHSLASMAGMQMLSAGGNAVDAAIAAAMTLVVVEPTGCGIGSDAFAIVWDGARLHGLNAAGRSPAGWTMDRFAGRTAMPERGWDAVTVPGAVSAWVELSKRFGRLPFEKVATPAIHYAREGFHVSPVVARRWAAEADTLRSQPGFAECFLPGGRAPLSGELFRSIPQANTLEEIATTRGESFYRGALASKLAAHARAHNGVLSLDDLGQHQPFWVDTLSQSYAGATVHELPPPGQGIATLMALGILEALDLPFDDVDGVGQTHVAIEATKLAFADLHRFVADPAAMEVAGSAFLDSGYLASRASRVDVRKAGDPGHGAPGKGGTVCLSAADASGMMISFIQSNYKGFGSGVVVPGTGISLQNRGCGFSLDPGHPNAVAPRKQPFHTIIPGFAMGADGKPAMAFGLMGGPMQAQGHLQMVLRILKYGQNPQAAADAPRWRLLNGRRIAVEKGMRPDVVAGLAALGHDIVVSTQEDAFAFGGAQIIVNTDDGYVAGSDPRKDGQALAL